MVRAAVDGFGGIDVLVNNAGIYPMIPVAELDLETVRRIIDINIVGRFLRPKPATATSSAPQSAGSRWDRTHFGSARVRRSSLLSLSS